MRSSETGIVDQVSK